MLQIIKEEKTRVDVGYRRIFQSNYECFGFHCEEDGTPIFRSPREEIIFNRCIERPHRFKDCGRVRREARTTYPAIARCECGQTIKLEKVFGKPYIECRCGRLYTKEGTEVSPAAQEVSNG